MTARSRHDLDGKRTLVVGASKGIGAAIAHAFAAVGADVALAARSTETLQDRCAALRQFESRAVAVRLDLSDSDSVCAGVAFAADALGGLDIVVNSGGISPVLKRVEATSIEDWDRVFSVNVRGAFLLAQQVSPYLGESGRGSVHGIRRGSVYDRHIAHPRWRMDGTMSPFAHVADLFRPQPAAGHLQHSPVRLQATE